MVKAKRMIMNALLLGASMFALNALNPQQTNAQNCCTGTTNLDQRVHPQIKRLVELVKQNPTYSGPVTSGSFSSDMRYEREGKMKGMEYLVSYIDKKDGGLRNSLNDGIDFLDVLAVRISSMGQIIYSFVNFGLNGNLEYTVIPPEERRDSSFYYDDFYGKVSFDLGIFLGKVEELCNYLERVNNLNLIEKIWN
ncbi:MAG TPA: hypothetical protein ENH99_01905 [Candidatus Pacearchaeota archaeon]|nr:hypothetical protein [Candidatus Pacearchaeota archaeon]